jgi:hypothetical protein
MTTDPVAQLFNDPRFKGRPITWEVTAEGYDAIRRAWLTHVQAEEKLFKPFTEGEFEAQMEVMLSVFTDDCVMELVTTGERWEGHVWTAPGCQGFVHVAALVGAAMCSAYQCGSQGRWP